MFEELLQRIAALTQQLKGGYLGHQDDLRLLVEHARSAIEAECGLVPLWEAEELAAAAVYANSNWLSASLNAVQKALIVNQLADNEYWGGYSYTKPGTVPTPRKAK